MAKMLHVNYLSMTLLVDEVRQASSFSMRSNSIVMANRRRGYCAASSRRVYQPQLQMQQDANTAGASGVGSVVQRSGGHANSFPLFVASVSTCRMFVSSPLHFIEDQCTDLLLTILKLQQPPPRATSLSLVKKIYNLCQGISSCLYQSLSTLEGTSRGGGKDAGG